jgi:ATP-dependent DNA helicase RecG
LTADPLQGSLQYLKGVGPRRAADLRNAGLATVEDLLYRFPVRYEDRSRFQTIASLKPNMPASVSGEVISSGIRPTRRPRFKIFELLLRDRPAACARSIQSAVPEGRVRRASV